MMLLRGIFRTVKCHIESRMQEPLNDDSPGVSCPGVKKVVTGRHHLRDFTERGRHKFGEKVLARTITTGPMNGMSPRYQYGIWGTTEQSVSSGKQTVCSELVKSGDWKIRTDGTQKQSTM